MLGVFFFDEANSIPCVFIFLLICCLSNCRVTFSWCPSGRGDLRNGLLPLCIFLFSSYASAASSCAIFRHCHAGVLCVCLARAFVGLLCTLKNSGCICFLFFSDFGPRQLPSLPRVAGGLGSAFERHTRNLAAVRVDVLVMTGRLLHRSVKRSYSEFLNTHLPFDVSSLQCNRGLVCSATRHDLHFGNSFTVHHRPSPDNPRKIPRSWYCLLKARPCHPALQCR